MIYCTNTIYGKIWKILRTDQKYMDVRMSTSEKDSDGNYVDSSWFPRIIGHAFNSLKGTLKEGDRITITKSIISNPPYKTPEGETKSSLKFRILEAKIYNPVPGNEANKTSSPPTTQSDENNMPKEEIPW